MTAPPSIATPAHYVTQQALAFGRVGEVAQSVDRASPLPVADSSFTAAVTIVPGQAGPAAARALWVDCTAEGRLAVTLAGGGQLSVPLTVGLTILPLAIVRVDAAGSTAVADLAVLL